MLSRGSDAERVEAGPGAGGAARPSSKPATRPHPAVARLAEGTEALRRIVADRPFLVAEALLDGVAPERVAEATGLDLIELRAAVSRWATRLLHDRRVSQEQYTELINRVFGPAS